MSGEKSASPKDDGGPFFSCEKPVVDPGPLATFVGLPLGLTPNRADFPVTEVDFQSIEIPLLTCASWSAQGLHSRGAMNGFVRSASQHKHLYTHGRHEWTVSNSIESLEHQRLFYERYLLDRDVHVPVVHLEVRHSLEKYETRNESVFPPESAVKVPLFLDAERGTLTEESPAEPATLAYGSESQIGRAHV